MTTAPAIPADMSPSVAAQHRAMPFTRLADCGMDPADARQLLTATAAGDAWDRVATDIGEAQHRRSVQAEQAGHRVTALEAERFATAALLFAQMASNVDDHDKRSRYHRYVQSLRRVAELSNPAIERIEIPYDKGQLVGWLCLPAAGRADATVAVWGGLSGWGGAYLPIADALTRRGLACLLAEGPGQGEARLDHGCYIDENVAAGFGSFVDAMMDDPRLGDRVGLQGNSFGGLFAARLAAGDPRIAACVVNGAPSTPFLPEYRSAREQIFAALGTHDEDKARGVLRALAFDGSTRPVTAPLLVLHGGSDRLVTEAEQRAFLRGANPATSQIRVWPDGEHTLYNHAAGRNALTADWFADHLLLPH